MDERVRNITVGTVTLASVIGLVFLLLLFGYVPRFLQEGYTIRVELEDAASLNPGSRVELAGIDIGAVESVEFKKPYGTGVVAEARIREDVQIPSSARAVINAPLLGGSPKIRFVVDGSAPNGDFLSTDGDETVTATRGDLAGAFGELEKLAGQVSSLTTDWREVAGAILNVTEQRDLDAVEAGTQTGNLTTVLGRMDLRMTEFRSTLESFNRLLGDPDLRENLLATAGNARELTEEASKTLDELRTRYSQLAVDLSGTLGQLETFTTSLNASEGTVGKLVNDPALYDNLNDAATRVQAAVDDARLLLDKWKAEGVPVKF